MTDSELVEWLARGQVVIVGVDPRPRLDPAPGAPLTPQEAAEAAWGVIRAEYDPCRAQRGAECLYCPWELCYRL